MAGPECLVKASGFKQVKDCQNHQRQMFCVRLIFTMVFFIKHPNMSCLRYFSLFTLLTALFLLISCTDDSYQSGGVLTDFAGNAGGFVPSGDGSDGDTYGDLIENAFISTSEEATSTFSVDADGGSYANVRRFLEQDNQLPPDGSVRTEELINYFDLDYPFDNPGHPISLNGEVSGCPWATDHRLIRIGIQGKDIPTAELPNSNFVFLVDVSGSMSSADKLELLKAGMHRFVDQMKPDDYLSIVTYASSTEVLLPSTSGVNVAAIRAGIDRLNSGGSTNGGAGILLAYEQAAANFIDGGNNRIIVGTDGDFNVGLTSQDELITLIEEKREEGVFLTVLGVGRGNYNEATMEQLANKGNGTYEYLDKVAQLEKVFFHETSKFYTVAKDVKVQIAFNPNIVEAYRLIGYENRVLNNEDFEDDTEDAGEIGAGQNITALYEIIPIANVDARSEPSFDIDFRYKLPDAETSILLGLSVADQGNTFAEASDYTRFTASVAAFGLLLIDSGYKGSANYDDINNWLRTVNLEDEFGYRSELETLVDKAKSL